jgi:hypothetical protein
MCLRLGLHVLGHLFRYYKVNMHIEQARSNVHSYALLGRQALLCHLTFIRVTLSSTSDLGLLWTRSLFYKGPQNLKSRNETEKKNSLRFLGSFRLGESQAVVNPMFDFIATPSGKMCHQPVHHSPYFKLFRATFMLTHTHPHIHTHTHTVT